MDTLVNPAEILDQLSPAIVITDSAWRIRYVNRRAAQASGRAAGELVGEHLLVAAARSAQNDTAGELLRRLVRLTASLPSTSIRERLPVCTPERRLLLVRGQPFHADGHSAGYLFLVTDATAEGELDDMKREFVSVASHEMRTPMTSIKGSLELLLGGYAGELPAEATELLSISLAAVDRLVRLINDLLDVSKMEAGKVQLKIQPVQLSECIRRSVLGLRSLAEAHRVSIQSDPNAGLPLVMADRDRLDQVITNLLANALKYSPANGIVRVDAHAADHVVRVSVTDQGPGIPAEQLEKIFDRFFQLEGAKQGSGLGLTICRALIQQHRGRIWAESQPGHGAQFYFELPAAPPA